MKRQLFVINPVMASDKKQNQKIISQVCLLSMEKLNKLRLFQCDNCSKVFKARHQLEKHIEIHINHCSWFGCDYQCNRRTDLQNHERLHYNQPFKCYISSCDISFSAIHDFYNHLKSHSSYIQNQPHSQNKVNISYITIDQPKIIVGSHLNQSESQVQTNGAVDTEVNHLEQMNLQNQSFTSPPKEKGKEKYVRCNWTGCRKIMSISLYTEHMNQHKKRNSIESPSSEINNSIDSISLNENQHNSKRRKSENHQIDISKEEKANGKLIKDVICINLDDDSNEYSSNENSEKEPATQDGNELEMRKHFTCGNCYAGFDTRKEFEKHHAQAHENKRKLLKTPRLNANPNLKSFNQAFTLTKL